VARGTNRPAIAAALSLFVPGFGQFYAGFPVWGIAWLLITPGFWIGTGGCLGWLCHVVAALQAWDQAARGRR
jgi:TM2 domain-containing membrane protein YozV